MKTLKTTKIKEKNGPPKLTPSISWLTKEFVLFRLWGRKQLSSLLHPWDIYRYKYLQIPCERKIKQFWYRVRLPQNWFWLTAINQNQSIYFGQSEQSYQKKIEAAGAKRGKTYANQRVFKNLLCIGLVEEALRNSGENMQNHHKIYHRNSVC